MNRETKGQKMAMIKFTGKVKTMYRVDNSKGVTKC
jgi:hypothetical protein